MSGHIDRRDFLKATTMLVGSAVLDPSQRTRAKDFALPEGTAPAPLPTPHFPTRFHAFVWRNWQLAPLGRMAEVIGATADDIEAVGRAMGLGAAPPITGDQQRRSYLTVIRRNWHLLPYEQLLTLLGWNAERLAFTLREDDFLFLKLGSFKPRCDPLTFPARDGQIREREREIGRIVREEFPVDRSNPGEPLFKFVEQLAAPLAAPAQNAARGPLRFCYSYFALYGDALAEPAADPYPDGYLARLAACGVNGVWLQAVLHKLALCPWEPDRSLRSGERLDNLRAMVARARRHGVDVYLYLNEPRALPLDFFRARSELKGVVEGDHAALCTSRTEVRAFLRNSVSAICRAVPELGGFFTITASENLTNCWSHGGGAQCPRCRERAPAEVIAEVNAAFQEGIADAGGTQRLIAWDWGWQDGWVDEIIRRLPDGVTLMSVSEWNLPIERGGVKSVIGEYAISATGPGPRAQRHWELARAHGLPVLAKIQAGNTWELSAVPYIPAVTMVAEHAAHLRAAKVDGLMLGWTLGGYPSPNLEVAAEVFAGGKIETVAGRRFGSFAPRVLRAWNECSEAFREFPFHIGAVYHAPFQLGPANLLWGEPTHYQATMVGFPYDDLEKWRAIYPPDVFIAQLEKVARGFESAARKLEESTGNAEEGSGARGEAALMMACACHWQSVANQSRFVRARQSLEKRRTTAEGAPDVTELERLLHDEIALARRLHGLQSRDSRLGFEASNQYYYVPLDLVEKVLNCRDLLDHWLPAQRARLAAGDQ